MRVMIFSLIGLKAADVKHTTKQEASLYALGAAIAEYAYFAFTSFYIFRR